jgi:DNA polymerase-3 subunit delta'
MLTDNLPRAPLPWQQPLWDMLSTRTEQNRLPHALLLQGAPGVGKGHLARLLAGALLCQKPAQGLPCGACHACELLMAGSHPDFFLAHCEYDQKDGGEGEDAESLVQADSTAKSKKAKVSKQIKMPCIRDLIKFSHYYSHQGGRRVVIIEPAEAMNRNTANALLKTLEEPGENLFIILVSHQASRLLPTLRSRCQSLFCATPSITEAQRWLAQFISPERATFALSFCGDAPLRALRAVNDGDDTHYQQMRDILVASQSGAMNYLQAGEALEKMDADKVIDWWLLYVHQACVEQLRASWVHFSDALLAVRKKMHSTANPNRRMLLESLLIDWMTLNR